MHRGEQAQSGNNLPTVLDGQLSSEAAGDSHVKARWVALGVAALGLSGFLYTCSGPEQPNIYGDADLDKAKVEAAVTKVVIEPTDSFHFATKYSKLKMNAEHIKYDITAQPHIPLTPSWAHGPDVIPDSYANKQLVGTSQEMFEIPGSAITQKVNKKTNKLDITVDPSKFTGALSWSGAGPKIEDYTIDDGKKNFLDRSGFRHSLDNLIGGNLKMLNGDKLSNTIEDIDNNVEHDMRLKGLDVLKTCAQKKPDQIKSLAKKAIISSPIFAPHSDEIGNFKFKSGKDFKIKIDTGEKAAKALGDTYSHKYQLDKGDFKVDSLKCFAGKAGSN